MSNVVRLHKEDPAVASFAKSITCFADAIDKLDPYMLKKLIIHEESQEAIRKLRKTTLKLTKVLGETPKFPRFPK